MSAWFPESAVALRERAEASLGRLAEPAVTVRRVLEVLREDGLLEPVGDWWAPLVLAEAAAELLTPLQAAAVAAHAGIAVPALAAAAAGAAHGDAPVEEARAVGYPLDGDGVDVRQVTDGVRLSGTHEGFAAADELHSFLLPVPGPAATRLVAVVPATAAGVRVVGATAVRLDGVFVRSRSLLPVDRRHLGTARLWLAAYEVAAARRLLARTRRHAGERRSFGRPLWEHQAVQLRIADLVAQADGARRLVHHAARTAEPAEPAEPALVAAAEAEASRLLRETAVQCQHLHGAAGYLAGQPAQHLLLGARVLSAKRRVDQRARTALAAARGWADE